MIISDHFVETRNRGTAGQNLERTQTVDYWVELGAATQVCFKTLVFFQFYIMYTFLDCIDSKICRDSHLDEFGRFWWLDISRFHYQSQKFKDFEISPLS